MLLLFVRLTALFLLGSPHSLVLFPLSLLLFDVYIKLLKLLCSPEASAYTECDGKCAGKADNKSHKEDMHDIACDMKL